MATNDFICDMSDKMNEDGMEYLIIAIQKGDTKHSANAYFNITSEDGMEMILTTVDEIFKQLDSDDPDSSNTIEIELPDRPEDDPDHEEGSD